MIVVCSQCTTRLQLDDSKLPSRPFTIRCPKCQHVINAQPPVAAQGGEQGALGLGESPSLEHPRFKQSAPAPAFNPNVADEQTEMQAYAQPSSVDTAEVVRMLAALLQGGGPGKEAQTGAAPARPAWERRRALVCVTPAHCDALAQQLAESNYQVFVADDSSQAIERMREEHMDVVILDPSFDPVEQGAAFVTREVNIKRPGERRRLFFVHLTASSRTLDSHAAFVNNVNMVFNPADIESLPQVLERALRDFNELYREFNNVLSVAAI
ncbi:MAG: zinc-ribbon domain-containing protein [Acidobacteria bacterium]|nr:zinc-ribbon domain-containing protein [Acidobacteriota bacterium]